MPSKKAEHCPGINDDEDEEIIEEDFQYIEIQELLKDESEQLISLPFHMRCSAHTLNLVATTDCEKAFASSNLKRIYRSSFSKASAIFNKQQRSTQAADLILEKFGERLLTPCVTRWNSTFDALVRLVNLIKKKPTALTDICGQLRVGELSQDELEFLESYCASLKPIAVALDVIQGESSSYLGILIPTLKACLDGLEVELKSESNSCKEILKILIESINQRFKHVFDKMEFRLATAVHPNLRLISENSSAEKEKIYKILSNKLTELRRINGISMEDDTSSCDELEGHIFSCFQKGKPRSDRIGQRSEEEVMLFLSKTPPIRMSLGKIDVNSFPSQEFKELFMKLNIKKENCTFLQPTSC